MCRPWSESFLIGLDLSQSDMERYLFLIVVLAHSAVTALQHLLVSVNTSHSASQASHISHIKYTFRLLRCNTGLFSLNIWYEHFETYHQHQSLFLSRYLRKCVKFLVSLALVNFDLQSDFPALYRISNLCWKKLNDFVDSRPYPLPAIGPPRTSRYFTSVFLFFLFLLLQSTVIMTRIWVGTSNIVSKRLNLESGWYWDIIRWAPAQSLTIWSRLEVMKSLFVLPGPTGATLGM